MEEIEWEDIKEAILENRVVLFLGHGLTVNYGDDKRERTFFEELFTSNKKEILAYHPDDNFLIFNSKKAKNKVRRKSVHFYDETQTNPSLDKLAQIPFQLNICLSPDTALVRSFENQNFDFIHDFCDGKHLPEKEPDFSDRRPLLYHLFGCTKDSESLIVSHNDLFDYIKFIHSGNQFQKVFGKAIDKDAYDYILFLGCDFDRWYFQLVLNLLNMGSANDDFEGIAADSLNKHNYWEDVYANYFNIKFVNESKTDDFINKLHEQFSADQLRKAAEKGAKEIKYKKENIFKLLLNGFNETEIGVSYGYSEEFEECVKTFTGEMKFDLRVKSLIDFAERKNRMLDLLKTAEDKNPEAYKQFGPYSHE